MDELTPEDIREKQEQRRQARAALKEHERQ